MKYGLRWTNYDPVRGINTVSYIPLPLSKNIVTHDDRYELEPYENIYRRMAAAALREIQAENMRRGREEKKVKAEAVKAEKEKARIMGFNANKFKNTIASERPMKWQGGSRAPFISPADLEDGDYFIRLLPSLDGKCKDGFRRLATHKLEVRPENDKVQFLCTADTPDGCAADEYLEKLEVLYDGLSDSYKTCIEELAPWSRVLFPAVITARKLPVKDTPAPTTKEKGSFTKRDASWTSTVKDKDPGGDSKKDMPEVVVIFQVPGAAKTVLEAIATIFEENPDVSDPATGHYILFRKSGNRYTLQPRTKSTPLRTLDWEKQYPNIDGMNKKLIMDRDRQEALLEGAWWLKKLEKKLEGVKTLMDTDEGDDIDKLLDGVMDDDDDSDPFGP